MIQIIYYLEQTGKMDCDKRISDPNGVVLTPMVRKRIELEGRQNYSYLPYFKPYSGLDTHGSPNEHSAN